MEGLKSILVHRAREIAHRGVRLCAGFRTVASSTKQEMVIVTDGY